MTSRNVTENVIDLLASGFGSHISVIQIHRAVHFKQEYMSSTAFHVVPTRTRYRSTMAILVWLLLLWTPSPRVETRSSTTVLTAHGNETSPYHQVEHRWTEKLSIGVLEKAIGSLPGWIESVVLRRSEAVGERLVERSGERLAERAGERLAERAGDRLVERGLERSGERWLEAGLERGLEQAGEKIVERGLERTGERLVERGLERSGERIVERGLERVGERGLEQAGERVAERSLERGLERTVVRSRVSSRAARGILTALPALGGIFALYLVRSDIQRWKEVRLNRVSRRCFETAAVADTIDALLHFVIAYLLLSRRGHWAWTEKLSVRCAVVSTVAAVVGEIWCLRKARTSPAPHEEL